MITTTKAPPTSTATLELDDAGNLVVSDGKHRLTVNPRKLDPAGRKAAMLFGRSSSDVHSLDELEPGERVIATEAFSLVLDNALPFPVLRGQLLDNLALIEMALRDGRRLIHEAGNLEIDSILREMTTAGQTKGMVSAQITLKRALGTGGKG